MIAAALLGAAGWAAITHWHAPAAHADSTFAYTAPAVKFIVRSVIIGPSAFLTVRMDTTTGDGWYANGTKWVKYADDTPPGPGAYDLQMMEMPDGKNYDLTRADLVTGRTWYISGTKWMPIAEQ